MAGGFALMTNIFGQNEFQLASAETDLDAALAHVDDAVWALAGESGWSVNQRLVRLVLLYAAGLGLPNENKAILKELMLEGFSFADLHSSARCMNDLARALVARSRHAGPPDVDLPPDPPRKKRPAPDPPDSSPAP